MSITSYVWGDKDIIHLIPHIARQAKIINNFQIFLYRELEKIPGIILFSKAGETVFLSSVEDRNFSFLLISE